MATKKTSKVAATGRVKKPGVGSAKPSRSSAPKPAKREPGVPKIVPAGAQGMAIFIDVRNLSEADRDMITAFINEPRVTKVVAGSVQPIPGE